MKNKGLKVKSIYRDSFFFGCGLRTGDIVLHVNGEKIQDELDFRFFSAELQFTLTFLRNGVLNTVSCHRPEGSGINVEFYENPINRCTNRCIFCFIDQMPPGLRKGLYIKDEDIKHSFINGNYVTLSNLTFQDLEKTARLGISPLYISVHATDTVVRNTMLMNKKAPPIMEQLRFLQDNGMYMHTQIVLCPGYNDGSVLKKTVEDLFTLGDALRSIAVVPVGVTRFRKNPLRIVDSQNALEICKFLNDVSDKMAAKDGIRRLFCADELFLRAGLQVPSHRYYEDYPQIENGIGLIRMLLEEWKQCKREIRLGKRVFNAKKPLLVLSSVSAFPYIKKICTEAVAIDADLVMDVVPVVNTYFGESVTVAGLLTAKDVISLLRKNKNLYKSAIVPGAMFNYAGSTLDGYSVERISKVSGIPVTVAQSIGHIFSIEN